MAALDLDTPRFHELISLLYDAALGVRSWSEVANRLEGGSCGASHGAAIATAANAAKTSAEAIAAGEWRNA